MKRSLLIIVALLSGIVFFWNGCKKDENSVNPPGTAPPAPTLSSPANNATNIAIPPTLTWNPSTGATSYTPQVSTNSSLTSFVYNQSGITSTTQQVTGLSDSTTYYWRASATNSNGTSSYSSVWQFTTASRGTPSTVTTSPITSITSSSASGGGNVTSQGSSSVTARGVCWSTSQNPTTANSKTSDGSGTGGFTSSITGLSASTPYYVRAYATNSAGTSYGSQVSFTTTTSVTTGTPCPGIPTVTYAGKIYHTVLIGGQCWLRENLDVGTLIDVTQEQTNNSTIEKYSYNNDPVNGGLYQWNEAMQYDTTARGICPTGWHIPTVAEFVTLSSTVGNDGNALKEIGQGSGNGAGTNTSGFSALLVGRRLTNGTFQDLGVITSFWTSAQNSATIAFNITMFGSGGVIEVNSFLTKNYGFSVRCIKD